MQKKNKKKGTLAFILVMLILFCFYPYEFTSVYFPFVPRDVYFSTAMTAVAWILFFTCRHRSIAPHALILIAIVQFLGLFIHNVYVGLNFIGQISTIFSVLFPLALVLYADSAIGLIDFYRRYNKWILIMAIMGTLTWGLVSFIGLSPFYYIPSQSDGRLMANYLLTFTILNDIGNDYFRYSGFFDEPGAMGYWGLYALIINKLFIKDKKLELLLSICLLFTFSFGYYLQLAVYLLLFNVNYKNFGRNLLLFALLAVIIVGANMTKGTSMNNVYEASIGRVLNALEQSQESENALAVDTRSNITDRGKELFLENPLMGTTREDERFGNNIYEPLAKYGLLGAPLVLFPFLYWLCIAIKRKDRDFLKAIIVTLIGFTHRPFHNAPLYFFIVYSILFMYFRYGIRKELANGKV